jgi:hypothetical protein
MADYPSLSALRRAETALAVVITDARREGYLGCLVDLERQILSGDTLEELLRWVNAQIPPTGSDGSVEPKSS